MRQVTNGITLINEQPKQLWISSVQLDGSLLAPDFSQVDKTIGTEEAFLLKIFSPTTLPFLAKKHPTPGVPPTFSIGTPAVTGITNSDEQGR